MFFGVYNDDKDSSIFIDVCNTDVITDMASCLQDIQSNTDGPNTFPATLTDSDSRRVNGDCGSPLTQGEQTDLRPTSGREGNTTRLAGNYEQ